MSNQLPQNGLLAAGQATATTTEQLIDVDNNYGGFRKVILDCTQCTTTTMFSIDKAVVDSTKVIYVSAGLTFEEYINGDTIYYKCATGTNTFNYVLL